MVQEKGGKISQDFYSRLVSFIREIQTTLTQACWRHCVVSPLSILFSLGFAPLPFSLSPSLFLFLCLYLYLSIYLSLSFSFYVSMSFPYDDDENNNINDNSLKQYWQQFKLIFPLPVIKINNNHTMIYICDINDPIIIGTLKFLYFSFLSFVLYSISLRFIYFMVANLLFTSHIHIKKKKANLPDLVLTLPKSSTCIHPWARILTKIAIKKKKSRRLRCCHQKNCKSFHTKPQYTENQGKMAFKSLSFQVLEECINPAEYHGWLWHINNRNN